MCADPDTFCLLSKFVQFDKEISGLRHAEGVLGFAEAQYLACYLRQVLSAFDTTLLVYETRIIYPAAKFTP